MSDNEEQFERAAQREGPIAKADLKVIKAAEPYSDNPVVDAVGKVSELADQPPLIAASLATILGGIATGDRRLRRVGIRMLASHAVATGIKTVLKKNFNRTRPAKVEKEGKHDTQTEDSGKGEDHSFPSGHTAGAVAVARAVAADYPGGAPYAYGAAVTTALVQIPRKAHFPSDIVVGAIIGLAAEALVSAVLDRTRL